MVKNPVIIVILLLTIEVLIIGLGGHSRTRHWFKVLPQVFWIYFLPMLASTLGLIDGNSPVLSMITKFLLPSSLLLLLVVVDVKAILKLGGMALAMFFAGSAGTIAGTVISFILFKNAVGSEFWAGFGAISASWTGGSANMIAVKEALAVPDKVFTPMVVVDTVIPYLWMGILIAAAGMQAGFDKWNRSRRKVLDDLIERTDTREKKASYSWKWYGIAGVLCFALIGGFLAQLLAQRMPVIKDVVSPYVWTIILVSVFGLILSFTPARRLENAGASKIGYYILYFVLTAIGAKASISNIDSVFLLIAAGFVIMLVHACFLLIAARLMRAPLFLVATASQANVGGIASGPIVAAIYQPGLASVGLLLAILGNILGTYSGILCGQICRFFSF